MPRRRIGQEVFRFGGESGGRASSLNELARLIDWRELDGLLVDIYAAPRGEAAWKSALHDRSTCTGRQRWRE